MKKQVNVTLQKEANKVVITDPKEMDIYELLDWEFRIILSKAFGELQEHRKTIKWN